MTNKPLILITNDDGIESPGLLAAAEAAAPLGDVLIAAPHHQMTASGRSFVKVTDRRIHQRSLDVAGKPVTAYSLKGSPAQIVMVAVLDLVPRRVDLVISGINFGENIGSGVTVSGTVGAALEAASYNIPALAISLETDPKYHTNHSNDVDFNAAGYFTRYFARKILATELPFDVDVLKVDVPAAATSDTPWRVTSVSRQSFHIAIPAPPETRGLMMETNYTSRLDKALVEPDSDIWAVHVDKIVSAAPLSLDLTSRVSLPGLQERLNGHIRRANGEWANDREA